MIDRSATIASWGLEVAGGRLPGIGRSGMSSWLNHWVVGGRSEESSVRMNPSRLLVPSWKASSRRMKRHVETN